MEVRRKIEVDVSWEVGSSEKLDRFDSKIIKLRSSKERKVLARRFVPAKKK